MTFSAVSAASRSARSRSMMATFTPRSLANLVAWFDADNPASVQIGTGVAAWTSNVATQITATQATANNQPAYQIAQQNGRNAIYFDGTNDNLGLGDQSAMFPSAASVVVAFRPDSDTEYALVITSNNSSFWQYPTNRTYIGTFKGTRLNNIATTLPTSGNTIVSITSDSSAYRVYTGTTLAHDVTADYSAGTNHRIGNNELGTYFKGWIYEVLYLSRALTAAEVTILNSYLSWKWRI